MWQKFLNLDWQWAHQIYLTIAHSPWLTRLAVILNFWLIILLAATAMVLLYKKRRPFVYTVVGGLVAYVVANIIAIMHFRPRPFVMHGFSALINESPLTKSFPSNHALAAFALATGIFLVNKKWGYVAYAVAILIALLRVAVGVHYISDIVAGAALGILSVWVAKKFI